MNTFREITRKKQALPTEECDAILEQELRGTLAVNGENGYPYALPINYYYDKATRTIYFHSGKTGYKVDCLFSSPKACFTVYNDGERNEGEWWLNVKSVIAFGKVEFVTDVAVTEEISRLLSLRFTKDENYIQDEIDKHLTATLLLAFKIEYMTGKVVHEK